MVTQMQYDSTSESKDRRISADVKTGVPGMFLEPRPAIRVDRAISSLYYTIASQRLRDDPVALQFVSPDAGAGTSFVAGEFAAFAARSHGGLALLVDCSITSRRGKKSVKAWAPPGPTRCLRNHRRHRCRERAGQRRARSTHCPAHW